VPGATDRSYGIQVARLAGVPEKVIERANEILKELEKENVLEEAEDSENGKKRKSKATARYTQMMLFDPENSGVSSTQANSPGPVEAALRKLNVEEMTPIEALNKLHELKRLLD
jgi:DNA mismatch repair protein MutS